MQAFLVGKDFGAMPAYEFALQHPDRIRGVVCLGIPFSPVPMSFGRHARRLVHPALARA